MGRIYGVNLHLNSIFLELYSKIMGATTDKQTLPPSKASKAGKLGRTRMKLIAAIRAEIKESGDFNANQVARRSKSSPANFYNHFATKDAATHAAYDQMMSELAASVSDQCRIESLLDSSMQVFVADWVLQLGGFFAENSSLFRLAQAGMGQSKGLRDLFRTHEQAIIETYQRFIERGQAAGQVRTGDQTAMAQMLVVFTESWHHRLVQKLKPGDPLHEQLTQAFIRILSPDKPLSPDKTKSRD